MSSRDQLEYKPLDKTLVPPVRIAQTARQGYRVDFGKVWFGALRLRVNAATAGEIVTVRLGEVLRQDGSIDPDPPGTARFREVTLRLEAGRRWYEPEIPRDDKNTGRRTIKMPDHIGEVMPFRYVEIVGAASAAASAPVENLEVEDVQLVAVHYPFNDSVSDFESSNEVLNRIWDLSKHTMFATTFCGMFVDGDRERYPREADAYINQLGYYCVDAEYALARHTHEFMLRHTSVWTEWQFHSIFMAWADLMYSGDDTSVRRCYDDLRAKLLLPLAREDGLIYATGDPIPRDLLQSIYRLEGEHIHPGTETILRDIVDWPSGERDGYDFRDYNTVVNAFHYRGLVLMAFLTDYIGMHDESAFFGERAALVHDSFQRAFFSEPKGLYVDGEGSDHFSLHANMFPLAFGLVPRAYKESVLNYVERKGMACSVYAAQYLLEALFLERRPDRAIELMTADTERSWKHMLDLGATITYEAWDVKFKPNMDQNHAWGAAPANILPRFVLGVRPLTPGGGRMAIEPQPGSLEYVRGKVPTKYGSIYVEYSADRGRGKRIDVEIPEGIKAEVRLGTDDVRIASPGHHQYEFDGG